MPWRWRGGGPSRSPTVHGGDKPQLCRAARHRATPRGALKRLRGLTTIALAGRSNGGGACRGRCSVPRWIGEPRRRHCFRRATRKARRVRDPRRRPASRRHSRTQRRRRRRPPVVVVRRFVSFPVSALPSSCSARIFSRRPGKSLVVCTRECVKNPKLRFKSKMDFFSLSARVRFSCPPHFRPPSYHQDDPFLTRQ